MVFSSKGCEGISAVEAVFCVLVPHPELPVQYFPSHLGESTARHTVDCWICMSLALDLLDGRYSGGTHR